MTAINIIIILVYIKQFCLYMKTMTYVLKIIFSYAELYVSDEFTKRKSHCLKFNTNLQTYKALMYSCNDND